MDFFSNGIVTVEETSAPGASERHTQAYYFGTQHCDDRPMMYISLMSEDPQDWIFLTEGIMDCIQVNNKDLTGRPMKGIDGFFRAKELAIFPDLVAQSVIATQERFGVKFEANPGWEGLLDLEGAAPITVPGLTPGMENVIRGIFGLGEKHAQDWMLHNDKNCELFCDWMKTVPDGALLAYSSIYGTGLYMVEQSPSNPLVPFSLKKAYESDSILSSVAAVEEGAKGGDFRCLIDLNVPTREQIDRAASRGGLTAHQAMATRVWIASNPQPNPVLGEGIEMRLPGYENG